MKKNFFLIVMAFFALIASDNGFGKGRRRPVPKEKKPVEPAGPSPEELLKQETERKNREEELRKEKEKEEKAKEEKEKEEKAKEEKAKEEKAKEEKEREDKEKEKKERELENKKKLDKLVLENANLESQILEIKNGVRLPQEIQNSIEKSDSLLNFYSAKELKNTIREILEDSGDKTNLLFQLGKRLGINLDNINEASVQNLKNQIEIQEEKKRELEKKSLGLSVKNIVPLESRKFSSLLMVIGKAKQFIDEFNESSLVQAIDNILSFIDDPIVEKYGMKNVFEEIKNLQEKNASPNKKREDDFKISIAKNKLIENLELLESNIKSQEDAIAKIEKDKSSINSDLELQNKKIAVLNKILLEAQDRLRKSIEKFNNKKSKDFLKNKKKSKSDKFEEMEF
ncbi:hypothetical protein [Holospora undulata]|uniref:Uncharacterized protein n=1 Tax=Holospora undulata HU1 TaxID=1321371 RepID=A0A061JIS3_9PROT|nr:hypothetical protein [Holospora undulata]ETZ05064.1 hypothetical protein K737_300515 [Holospora undulata HU1]